MTEFCCNNDQIDSIAIQYLIKYIFGTLFKQNEVVAGISLFNQVDFQSSCKLVNNANESRITEAQVQANRSINGMYYGIAKWVEAFAPLAQAETCLICANDATIN